MASKYEKQANKYIKPFEEKALAENKKLWQEQAQAARKYYDNQIFEEGRAYEDQYRDVAVQKAINERQVAESMANMGLTDSGLNRTQITAINLSAANNRAAIDRARQQGIDNLNLKKTSDLASIRQGWLADRASIKQNYDKARTDYAASLYDSAVSKSKSSGGGGKSGDEVAKGYILSNGSALPINMQGNLRDNGITVLPEKNAYGEVLGYKYVDNNTGKSTIVRVGVNPFTWDDNSDSSLKTDTALAYQKYGAFENGYQPKGIYYNGKDYGWVSFSGIRDEINGNIQNVHKTKDGSLWIWDRAINKYRPYEE